MSIRNRAEGWQYAKLTGHENEALIEALVKNDNDIQNRLLECAKIDGIVDIVDFGGLRETNVDCILGGKTKSKSDMHIYLVGGKKINISIKKSLQGQVFLIGIDRFVSGYEKHYSEVIPSDVKRAISLFWGSAADTKHIINNFAIDNIAYQVSKHRLVKSTLDKYSNDLSNVLLKWFNDKIFNIFDFCFSKGLVSDKNEWADIIWYKNALAEDDIDKLFNISLLKEKLIATAEYGIKTGGSTIQLPFGFVQWHSPRNVTPGEIQFHHKFDKIDKLINL